MKNQKIEYMINKNNELINLATNNLDEKEAIYLSYILSCKVDSIDESDLDILDKDICEIIEEQNSKLCSLFFEKYNEFFVKGCADDYFPILNCYLENKFLEQKLWVAYLKEEYVNDGSLSYYNKIHVQMLILMYFIKNHEDYINCGIEMHELRKKYYLLKNIYNVFTRIRKSFHLKKKY